MPRRGPIELAWDLLPLLENDPGSAGTIAARKDAWVVGARSRHSHDSTVQS